MADIPLVDLKAQYAAIRGEINAAIQETLDQAAFIMGERVAAFEREFAGYCGARFGVAASSGTTALHLALAGCGIGAGDEVITVSHTFVATAEAICHCGATPVFADVDPKTWTLDPAALEAAITDRTRAVIPVHLYGRCAAMEPIVEIARRHGLAVIEDAAQAHGAQYGDQRAGALGDFGCFSFYPGKNLGAYGDAGMVTTSDEAAAERLGRLANHGRETKYRHDILGFNYRMDALQAAILRVKLRHLDAWTQARRRLAQRYAQGLRDLPLAMQEPSPGHAYHLFVIACEGRDSLAAALKAAGIASGIHYPIPLHLQPCFAHLAQAGEGCLPVTERLAGRIVSLPLYPEMTSAQQDRVIEVVRAEMGNK